jgi:phosphoenolpyruvate phosphomutase
MEEFAGKIKAVKDAQVDPDFSLVARLEAFISGWGMDEALRRAEAYHAAGADALLIHSKKSNPTEILQFAKEWGGRCPIVIVPTMYYSTPTEVFEEAGIGIVIWANHNVRASITAMQRVSRKIFAERSVAGVEDSVATVKEVFRLQNADELLAAEERYLPQTDKSTRAIILAASQGDLGALTSTRPKAMVPINGEPLLHKLAAQFRAERVKDITVVRGFGRESIDLPNVQYVDNAEFASTYELYSLNLAAEQLKGSIVLSFGDILFRKYILQNLLAHPGEIVIAVDAAWQGRKRKDEYLDYVTASHSYTPRYGEEEAELRDIGPKIGKIDGEWIGLLKASPSGTEKIHETLKELSGRADFRTLRCDALLRELVLKGVRISIVYITGHWLDVDNLDDLSAANATGI